MKRQGWHLASDEELSRDYLDHEVAFRRDPDGLCQAVGTALNRELSDDPLMQDWEWALDWENLPGAISVMVTGSARNPQEVQCPAFFAATSVADYHEVDAAAERLKLRIQRSIYGWA